MARQPWLIQPEELNSRMADKRSHGHRRRTKRRLAARVTAHLRHRWCVGAFVLLVGGFWFFQIAQHDKFKEMAENNHQRTLPLRAPRGVIFDRHGRVLVENRNSFNISILREHSKDLERTIRAAGRRHRRAGRRDPRDRRAPSRRADLPADRRDSRCDARAGGGRRGAPPGDELPDVVVQEVPTRQYPVRFAGGASDWLRRRGQRGAGQRGGYSLGTIVGQTGVEKIYNELLMGQDGARRVVVNSLGREIGELESQQPVEGTRVQLTLNLSMQKAAEDGFQHSATGARRSCSIRATATCSRWRACRRYDPNAFAAGIDRATWTGAQHRQAAAAAESRDSGTLLAGSTFKVLVVATAASKKGSITPASRVFCTGGATFYGRYFQCHKKGGHGSVDLRHAIEKSCNVYFYTLGNMLGVDRIHKWAENLGLHGRAASTCRTRGQPRAVERVEEAAHAAAVVSGRDDLRRHRPGTERGDADGAGGDDGDARQRRHAFVPRLVKRDDSTGSGGRPCRAGTRSPVTDEARARQGDSRRPVAGGERRRHRRPRAHRRAATSRARRERRR